MRLVAGHEHEQRAALAALTYAADCPDARLIGLLTALSPANVVAVIKTGGLPGGAELREAVAGYLSVPAQALPWWRTASATTDQPARHPPGRLAPLWRKA